jgi:hypothetical protein
MNSQFATFGQAVLALLSMAALGPAAAQGALLAHYSFEGNAADQAVGDGAQNLTLAGDAALTSPGIKGAAKLSLDGSGDYASSPSPGTNAFTSGNGITLTAWFTTTAVASNTQQVLIHLPIAGGTLAQAAAGMEIMAGKLQVGGRSISSEGFKSNDATLPSNTLTLAGNTTYFAAAAIDYANDMITAYLYDGAIWKSQAVSVTFANSTGSGNQGLNIGRRADGQRPFNGAIDDVMIFNTTLSQAEVQAIAIPEPGSAVLIFLALVLGAAHVRTNVRLVPLQS